MFLDMVGVIATSKLNILSTFQGGAPGDHWRLNTSRPMKTLTLKDIKNPCILKDL